MSAYLAMMIKHARGTQGLTQDQAGEAVHVSGSLIAMFETGKRIPKPDTAERLDRLFSTGDLIQKMSVEARKGHQPEWFRPFVELEGAAKALRWYEPHIIPGLLQTEAYARTVLNSGLLTPERAEELVTTRLDRQRTAFDRPDPPVCTFVIDEDALQRGDAVMLKEQLLHLIEVGERPRVFVHVVPATGFHVGLSGSFVLASVEGETAAQVDDQLSGRTVTDASSIATLEHAWQAICAVALPCGQSRDLIMKRVNAL